jgi:hypothetical protein
MDHLVLGEKLLIPTCSFSLFKGITIIDFKSLIKPSKKPTKNAFKTLALGWKHD